MARPLVVQGSPTAPRGPDRDRRETAPSVTLTWSAPIFPPPAVAFVVERADDEGFSSGLDDLHGGGRRHVRSPTTPRRPAARSFYRVRAESAAGFSPWSAPAEVAR